MEHIPSIAQNTAFAPASKVWTYLAERPLTAAELTTANTALQDFIRQWTAHNQALRAGAEIFADQIIILVVDETQAGASGCSIDKSVHFLEALGHQLGIDFFNRMQMAWIDAEGEFRVDAKNTLSDLRKKEIITENTLMINTLAPTLGDIRRGWAIPLGSSWHQRII